MSFFEGATRVEFVDVEAIYLCIVKSHMLTFLSDFYMTTTCCFLGCTKLARLYYFIRPTTRINK